MAMPLDTRKMFKAFISLNIRNNNAVVSNNSNANFMDLNSCTMEGI
jgi:hypothetical protein